MTHQSLTRSLILFALVALQFLMAVHAAPTTLPNALANANNPPDYELVKLALYHDNQCTDPVAEHPLMTIKTGKKCYKFEGAPQYAKVEWWDTRLPYYALQAAKTDDCTGGKIPIPLFTQDACSYVGNMKSVKIVLL